MLKFKVDENLPTEVAGLLAHAGYDAMSVFDQHLQGRSDAYLSSICQRENRIILTLDLDLSDIRVYPPADYPGIIVLRIVRQDKFYVLSVVKRLLTILQQEAISGKL
jgi:predicted nuclease of predicted toxin-antitoxin system